ncbi:hypothetical protein JTE90_002002 [Oedothorax gibbosus]|uniref:Thioredoxin domain-containing protein n=1 Tax=Oedothorax gibbosus TaxID=931172 RepID=A0AAV6UAC1_9ARAC|nr:hypothetical protein JTE90_002002 [Oedothorax gibbosus]
MYSKFFTYAVVCLLVVDSYYCSDLYSDKVLNYDAKTFNKKIGGTPHFVNFFAPWCGYCKRLKPVWDELAEKYNKKTSDQELVIAKVDCTVETPICAEEGVSGYPSLIFYAAGEKKGVKYQGKRDLIGLEDFISNNIGENRPEVPASDSKPTVPEHGAVVLTDATFQEAVKEGMHFVKFFAPWCGHCQRMAGTWAELAESLQGDTSVTIAKIDCTENKETCADFEVKGYPTLLWIMDGKKIEKYQGSRTLEAFKQFVNDMKKTHGKDLPDDGRIPDPKDETNLVVELSAENFENAISKGLTFVKFFVPWCGHCKRLEPIWKDLALKYASSTQVKIAQVDCTKDEKMCADKKIVGYPTLFLYRDGKFLTESHGERKLEALHSFVLEYIQHSEL